jgi:hypothetical protein
MLSYEAVKNDFTSAGVAFDDCELDGEKVIIIDIPLRENPIDVKIGIRFEEKTSICNIYTIELAKVEFESKQYYQMLALANKFNLATNYVKMYVKEDGSLWSQLTLDMGRFDVIDLRMNIATILDIIDTKYISDIMKIRWA